MFKKILSALMALSLVAALFTGCTGKGKSTPEPEEDNLLAGGTIESSIGVTKPERLLSGQKAIFTDNSSITVRLPQASAINTVILQEPTDNVLDYELYALVDSQWQLIHKQDRIDAYRVCAFEDTQTNSLRLDILKTKGKVCINSFAVYQMQPVDTDFRVSSYLTMSADYFDDKKEDPGFKGYFNVITDAIMFTGVSLDASGNIIFAAGEEAVAKNISDLKGIIASSGRDVKIWMGINNMLPGEKGDDINQMTAEMINGHMDAIGENLRAFCEKYDIYGIDYDWEYPSTAYQWKAYSKLLIESTKALEKDGRYVSVALAPWGVRLSKEAKLAVHHVNIMSYDIFDDRGDHSSIYNQTENDVQYFLKKGFTAKQLWLGIPFYGRPGDRGAEWPVYTDSFGKWGNIDASFSYKKDGQTITAASYHNGYAMVRDKTAYSILRRLGGVMIFSTNCDAPYTDKYSLHEAIEWTIGQRIAS